MISNFNESNKVKTSSDIKKKDSKSGKSKKISKKVTNSCINQIYES